MRAGSLFLHSTGTGPFMWAGVPDEVVRGTDRVMPANVGYPPNPPVPRGERVTAEDDARNALAAIGGYDEIDIYAHSYGGVVALALLPMLGARVRSLFLLEPVLFGALARDESAEASAEARAFLAHPWFLHDDERAGSEDWLETFIDYWNRPGSWARLPPEMQAHSRSVAWKMSQEVRGCFLGPSSFDDIVLPKVRVTLARGERSPAASRAMVHAIATRNPHAHVVELPKAGHMAPLTHASVVYEAMLRARS